MLTSVNLPDYVFDGDPRPRKVPGKKSKKVLSITYQRTGDALDDEARRIRTQAEAQPAMPANAAMPP